MGKGQKFITITLWAVLIAAMVGVVVGKLLAPSVQRQAAQSHMQTQTPDDFRYPAAEFALTDQDGKPLGSKDLRGRVYLADFIFTTCGDACPRMSRRVMELVPKLPADVQVVSFTVNPEHDTPEVLKEYAKTYKADTSRWHFLTGTPQQMFDVAHGMKLPAEPANGETPILHSEKILLIDADGTVRGFYNSNDDEAMKRLVADAEKLVKEAKEAKDARRGGAGTGGGVS